jgi:hypothetical protein
MSGRVTRSRWLAAAGGVSLALAALGVAPALAAHPVQTLSGSNFEIDTDANLLRDDPDPSLDWVIGTTRLSGVTVIPDAESGQNDDSFGNGSKEDTLSPSVVAGSIPPNKSDLKEFGVYLEEDSPGFLNLFWSRVQDPSGTTNMDFEFNENKCEYELVEGELVETEDSLCAANGVTPVRTAGDLLITYDLSRGGTVPTLSIREWSGSAWGPADDLTASADAAGSINTSAITAVAGLGPYSPRTFGEAQVDLSAIFDETQCESFGSAYLKSRSSDSFTAALKDFIAPEPVNIANCGSVQITKSDDAGNALAGVAFTLYTADDVPGFGPGDVIATDQDGVPLTCTTAASGICTIDDVIFGDYWVDETGGLDGYDPDTDLPELITVDSTTTVSLSYVNPRMTGSILVEKVVAGTTTRLDGAAFTVSLTSTIEDESDDVAMTEVADGLFCLDGLLFGGYTVTESTTPDGYVGEDPKTVDVDSASTCADRTAEGEEDTPDLTFANTAQPTIVTQASGSVTVGADITDTATLSGGADPTGTITFTAYSDDQCTVQVFTDDEDVDSGNGDYTSDAYTTTAAGTIYWIASYSGDDSNASASGACGDANESSVVNQAKPTITTSANQSVTVGDDVSDTAELSGGYHPTGTIVFKAFDNDQCSAEGGGTKLYEESVTVTGNGTYGPVSFTTDQVGTVYWKAVYSGDDNNESATHACGADGEVDTVGKDSPSISTTPVLLPNDSALLSGGFGTLGGSLTFELFASADCSGDAMYKETVQVDGAGTYATSNDSVEITADGVYSWEVSYSGDSSNNGAFSTCTAEQMSIDFTPLEP